MKGVLSNFAKKAYDISVRSFFNRFVRKDNTPSKTSPRNSVFISILSPFETYVVSLQSLLIWEKPYLSAVSFVLLNCLFWLVVSWNRRFLSILSILILTVYVYRVWINQIWPEIRVRPPEHEDSEDWIRVHPKVLSVPELGHYANDFVDKITVWWKDMMRLRQTNHAMFCLLGCAMFSVLAFVGHMVPGVLIIYVLVLALSLGPGIVLHLIPATIYDQIAGLFMDEDTAKSIGQTDGSKKSSAADLAEFLPETSPDVLKQLSIPQDPVVLSSTSLAAAEDDDQDEHHLSTIRELGMDSFVSDSESALYAGLGAFPSVAEENESDLEDEDDDLQLGLENNGIHFVPTHFNENSSESESDVFTEGLSFKNVPDIIKEPTPEAANIPSSSKSDKDHQKTAEKKPRDSTSSDVDEELMDFEFLEKTDIS